MTYRAAGPLVGLIGYARAGKDTLAAELVAGYGYRRIAFADPLREVALRLDPIIGPNDDVDYSDRLRGTVEAFGWEYTKTFFPEARRLLQNIGASLRDLIDENLWLDTAMRQVDSHAGPVVVTDVRYPNEARAIRERGGILVRVVRRGNYPVNEHDSETALDHQVVDLIIRNGGTVDELREKAHAIHRAFSQ